MGHESVPIQAIIHALSFYYQSIYTKRPVENYLHRSVSFARSKLSLLRLRDETLILSSLYAVSSNLSAINYCRIYRVNLSAVE